MILGVTVTLTNAKAYNMLALIQALPGYSNVHPTCRELDFTPAGGTVYAGGADVTTAFYGLSLTTTTRSPHWASPVDDIPLGDIWLYPGTAGMTVNIFALFC